MSGLVVRPGIMDIAAYVPGEAKSEGQVKPIRLAANENPLGPSPLAIAAYEETARELHRYPDGGSIALRQALAELHGLDWRRILCGTGSDELINLLVRAYAGPGDEVIYSAHGFLLYAIAARSAGATPVPVPETNLTADVDALLAAVTEQTRVVFLANPNNPTGSCLRDAEVRRLQAGLPDHVLLVLDAAYAEYVERADYEAGGALVEAFENVVMLRTFSKIYGLASVRLGWGYFPEAVADVLERIRGVFNVNLAAQAAGLAAVGDQGHIEASRAHNSRCLAWFSEQVARLGLQPVPSCGNFLIVRFPGVHNRAADAAALHLKHHGILVRSVASYGLPDYLRITVGTEPEMQAVVAALEDFLS